MPRPDLPEPVATTQRVWSVMRQLRRFTLDDLVAVAECPLRTVKGLVYLWRRHGIVHADNDGYRLGRDLGPLPPFGRGRAAGPLIDRNNGAQLPLTALPGKGNRGPRPKGSGRQKLSVPRTVDELRERNRRHMQTYRERRRAAPRA